MFGVLFLSSVQNFAPTQRKRCFRLFDTVSVFWQMAQDTLITYKEVRYTRRLDTQDSVKKISSMKMFMTRTQRASEKNNRQIIFFRSFSKVDQFHN